MPLRAVQLTEDTTITLEDGKQVHTRYDSERKRHMVTCDLCNTDIKLPATANSYTLELHRNACKLRLERRAAKKFLVPIGVPEAEESFNLPLLFQQTSASLNPNGGTNGNQVECSGQWVQWSPGSIWETYPFRLHKSKDVGWIPISIDDVNNGLVVQAKQCWRQLDGIDSEDGPSPCSACKKVPHTVEFKTVVERAQNVKEHTPWMYLTDLQKEKVMRQMAITIWRLRAQVNNSARSHRVLNSRIQEHKQIMMLIASNDIPRLTQLLTVSLRHGSSAKAIVNQIQCAIDGLYSPRGGFKEHDLDIAFLCQAMGGRRLLYTMTKSNGLPSESTIRRNKVVPRLLPSVGVPTAEEVSQNISAFLDPAIKPPPPLVNGTLPGNILGFDGVSIEKKCRYCPKRGVVLGLCREHSENVNVQVTDSTTIGRIWDALEANDASKNICWGSEATVVVVAPYSRTDYYCPTPLVLSPTDKSENGESLGRWIQTVINTWNTHENGAAKNGPLWSIASDGDATFRRARHELCNRYQLDLNSPLGQKLEPLLGFNLYTSKEIITATCDPKHIFKRFATLLRSTGITVKDQLIGPNDIREQLIERLGLSLNEVNDLLNAQDKQNVPKAVKLLQHLGTLPNVPPPTNEFSRLRYDHTCFISQFFGFFVEPFVDVRMNLDQQLESLSTFAHLAVALQLEYGAACLTGPLYADTQAIIKNIYFLVARLQLISSDLTLHLIHEGTDRLERLFGDCCMLDHGRNFDILQLSEKMAIATLINSAYERNPDLDRGHRRLDLSSTIGVDHVNPKSWLGDTSVRGINLAAMWNQGRSAAIRLLELLFGIHKVQSKFNFESIFSSSKRDMLRPNGTYVGMRPTKEELQLDQPEEVERIPSAQNKPMHNKTQQTFSEDFTRPQNTIDIDIAGGELDLESDLPDDPEEELKPPQSFLFEGSPVKIDSAISSIHPNSWRQMSDRIYRVRGWNLDQFNAHQVENLVDAKDAVNDALLKIYDIIGILVRVEDDVCFTVMEVKGVTRRAGNKKTFSMSAKYSELASTTSNITILGQIIKLVPSAKQSGYWEWAREYVVPLGNSKNRGKKQSFMMEVASHLIHPLSVNMISYHNEPPETRLRWALSTEELQKQMSYAWSLLSPEFNIDLSKFESIPIIKNSESLPYRNKDGSRFFVVRNIPNHFLNRNVQLFPEKLVHCLVCGVEVQLKLMRGHVGKHILWDMRGQIEGSDFHGIISPIGVMPCGFCGLEGCTTTLTRQHNGDPPIIKSTCIYHTALDYQATSKGNTGGMVCSNVPVHCCMCPLSPEGEQRTIWKYNALMHILIEHEQFDSDDPNLCILPDVPISMQAKIHISRAEETALGIKEELTMEARADFNLLNSDDLPPEVMEDYVESKGPCDGVVGKRPRTETQSTIKPPSKKTHF